METSVHPAASTAEMTRAAALLLLALSLDARERLSERYVYVNQFYLAKGAPRAPDLVALIVLWPDGRLHHVDAVVRPGSTRGSIRVLFDSSAQVAAGRWAWGRRGGIEVKIPRFTAHTARPGAGPLVEGLLIPEGKAAGRPAASLRGGNAVFVAVPRVENLRELEAFLK